MAALSRFSLPAAPAGNLRALSHLRPRYPHRVSARDDASRKRFTAGARGLVAAFTKQAKAAKAGHQALSTVELGMPTAARMVGPYGGEKCAFITTCPCNIRERLCHWGQLRTLTCIPKSSAVNEPPRTFVEEEHRQMDAERTPAGFRHYLRNLRKSESSPQRVRCDMFIANSGLSTGQFWSLAQAGEFCWTTCWQVFMPAGCQMGVLQALLGLRMKLAFHSTAKSRFSPSQAD